MTEIQIAWLELMTVGGLGVILVLLGVVLCQDLVQVKIRNFSLF